MPKAFCNRQVRRQISIFLPNADWRALREEAARQRLPLTELCRRWLRPGLERLRSSPQSAVMSESPSARQRAS